MSGNHQSGRKPIPTALKELRGTVDKRTVNDNEPSYMIIDTTAPKELEGPALVEWNRLMPVLTELGVLSYTDRAVAIAYCVAYERFCEAYEEYKREGAYDVSQRGGARRSACVQEMDKAMAMLHRLAVELGLTPSSRSRIVAMSNKEREEDPLSQFLSES